MVFFTAQLFQVGGSLIVCHSISAHKRQHTEESQGQEYVTGGDKGQENEQEKQSTGERLFVLKKRTVEKDMSQQKERNASTTSFDETNLGRLDIGASQQFKERRDNRTAPV